MNRRAQSDADFEPETPRPRADLSPRSREVGVIAWCSFLTASAACTLVFAFLDPAAIPLDAVPMWWQNRRALYALGFFFFWAMAAASASITLYMLRSDSR